MNTKPATELPPQDLAAERGLLGAILRHNSVFDEIRSTITADDFYLDGHRKIFTAIAAHLDAGKPCDLVIVFEELRNRGWLKDAGDAKYLAECWEVAPTGAEATYYAGIVRQHATRRRVVHLCTEKIRDAMDGIMPADEMMGQFESDLFKLSDSSLGSEPVKIGEVIDQIFHTIGQPPKPGVFIRTGLGHVDNIIGGFKPGRLYVIAARPSVGKSAFTQQVCEYAARYENARPLMISLEMGREELTERALARGCQVPIGVISGTMKAEPSHYEKLLDGVDGCRTPFLIDDCEGYTVATLSAIARRAMKRNGVNMLAIDYLQLMEHVGERGDNLNNRIGNTTRALKKLSRKLKIPVILLSQLSRDLEKRGMDSEPQLSDLRDSGNIEQDADVVIMLHPTAPIAVGQPPKEQQINAYIRKQRGGPKGVAELSYEGPVFTFRDKLNNW